MKFTVYVPRKGSTISKIVEPKSAIIKSRMVSDDLALVYFEGNSIRASNINTFEDKCMLAAGRARDKYPTIAKACVDIADVIDVGVYDLDTNQIHIDENYHDLFHEWADDVAKEVA